MSDTDLKNYQSQLQQVEASLIVSPDNEDLLKLKKDLQEVIDLTKELLGLPVTSKDQGDVPSDVPFINWSVGDRCSALWAKDQQYYSATIVEVLDDGLVSLKFDKYSATNQVTQVSLLKQLEEGARKRVSQPPQDPHANYAKKTKKDLQAAQREYKRKKNEKKRLRTKELEEQKEKEKNKWLSFNSKVFSKTTKGKVKKSIFASPESAGGKVGVGTCGHSGQPMTAYHQNEKWKKAANL